MLNVRIQQPILAAHRAIFPFPKDWMDATGPASGGLIKTLLLAGKPCLIARFGSIEMEAIMAYLHQDTRMTPWQRLYRFVSWDVRYRGWTDPLKRKLVNNAGFFPATDEHLDRFAKLYLDIASEIDLLGSWIHPELLLRSRMPNAQHIPLDNLEPYLGNPPWSKALEGKKVLVIHPFTESITLQYAKREKLFDNPDILPPFELTTLKAVQSAGGNNVPFANWFEALDFMKAEIDKLNFDIAIIGAGAYGLPLAAYVKSIEKQAIHMGGALQMLFGIYGQRWISNPARKHLINEHWIRPLDTDKIENFKKIESGCYW